MTVPVPPHLACGLVVFQVSAVVGNCQGRDRIRKIIVKGHVVFDYQEVYLLSIKLEILATSAAFAGYGVISVHATTDVALVDGKS